MNANEYTRLREPIKVLSYQVLQQPTDLENEDVTSHSTNVSLAAVMSSDTKRLLTGRAVLRATATTFVILFFATLLSYTSTRPVLAPLPKEGAAWSAIAQPLSFVNPESMGFIAIDRPVVSMPGPIFGDLLLKGTPLPTNSWCENFFLGNTNTASMNRVFVLPYVIDTDTHNGNQQGVNTHPAHVQANDRTVEVTTILPNRGLDHYFIIKIEFRKFES